MSGFWLSLDVFADILNGVPDFPARLSEAFLNLARRLVNDTFVMQAVVIGGVSDGLFDLALGPVQLAVQFIAVHGVTSRRPERNSPARRSSAGAKVG